MREIVNRAWKDTLVARGLSSFSAIRLFVPWLLGSGAIVLAVWLIRGWSQAMIEGVDIAIYVLAGGGAVFVATFLWNLWLAPYRIMDERLDEIVDAQRAPRAANNEQERRAALNVKRAHAQQEMKRLRLCIKYRKGHKRSPVRVPKSLELDSDYLALTEKYSAWFPGRLSDHKMAEWSEQISAILRHNDYETSDARIKRAVADGSWEKQERAS